MTMPFFASATSRILDRITTEKASTFLVAVALLFGAGCGGRTVLLDRSKPQPPVARPDAEPGRPDTATGSAGAGWLRLLAGALGGDGNIDGVGAAARFRAPHGIASDGAGSLFVVDYGTIRRVSIATGEVTTLAGSPGEEDSRDGIGPAARFHSPKGITSDQRGLVFVADSSNYTIRKIVVATGEVTTLAGTPRQAGSSDGFGATARFTSPNGLASDGEGLLYVADNAMIRRVVVATGEVTTIAGAAGKPGHADGIGTAARFTGSDGLALDSTGSLFVAASSTIRQVNLATGKVTTLAGSPAQEGSDDGIGSAARFQTPSALASDQAGNLYVADFYNSIIRKVVVATGEVTTIAGVARQEGSQDGAGASARFAWPAGVVSDGAGHLFVTDNHNNTIRQVNTTTNQVTTLAGSATQEGSRDGSGPAARFASPAGMAWDQAGPLYVVDARNHTIRRITTTGEVTTLAGAPDQTGSNDGTGTAARFHDPTDIVYDGTGALYITDMTNRTIRKLVIATRQVVTFAGSPDSDNRDSDGIGRAARFGAPMAITSDGQGNLFMTEWGAGTVRKVVMATAEVTTLAGSGALGAADGIGAAASFYYPMGIASDGAGRLYVADSYNHAIRKIVIATREVTTVAGSLGQSGSRDGVGREARFHMPVGIVVDGAALLVADRGNKTVRRVDPATGAVTTVIGSPDRRGVRLGPLPASLREPWGLALGPTGELAISDATENAILLASPRP